MHVYVCAVAVLQVMLVDLVLKYLMIHLVLGFFVVVSQIKFGPYEYVKEISGHGHKANISYLCQLKIVTNLGEYGPFGDWTGIPFRFTFPEHETVVGFFGSYDTAFITKIGAYTISGTRPC
jgi:hypothetical protein